MGHEQRDLFDKQPPPWELDDQREVCVAVVVFAEVSVRPLRLRGARRHCGRRSSPACACRSRWDAEIASGSATALPWKTAASGERALKPITSVVDGQTLLSPAMLRLTHWMARYYLCPLGQVLDAVIPAGVRGQAGTREQVYLSVPTATAARLTQLRLSAKQAGGLAHSRDVAPRDDAPGAGGGGGLHGGADPGTAAQEAGVGRSAPRASGTPRRRPGAPRRSPDAQSGSAGRAAGDPGAVAQEASRDDRHPRRDGQRQDGGLHPGH